MNCGLAQALLALEQCFLHDGGKFLDEQRFQRLLPPLVAQFPVGPTTAAAASVVADLAALLPSDLLAEGDAEVVGGGSAVAAEHHERLPLAEDPYGVALAAALVRLAAAAGSDVMHRPLNRAVRALSQDMLSRMREVPKENPHSLLVHVWGVATCWDGRLASWSWGFNRCQIVDARCLHTFCQHCLPQQALTCESHITLRNRTA